MASAIGENRAMQFQKIAVPVASVALIVGAYHYYSWGGVAAALGALVMWLLLHFTRLMQVFKRAAKRPIGYVGSAVMLNAKLEAGMTLLHVTAMTRSLGELISPADQKSEHYRWSDATESQVECEFFQGKLKSWQLIRPRQTD